MRTQDEELKKIVIKKIEDAGSFEYTKKRLEKLKLEMILELGRFEDNALIQELMQVVLLKNHEDNE